MPPKMSRLARRGSIALSMLDNQSLAPRLESVLSSVNPPSEDAAFQVIDTALSAAIWKSHQVSLDSIARHCGAQKTTRGLVRLMAMTSEFLVRDEGDGGPNRRNLEGDEPVPCLIDVRARGRVVAQGWDGIQPPLDGSSLSEDMSDDGFSWASSSGRSFKKKPSPTNRRDSFFEGGGGFEELTELPLTGALNIRKVPGRNRGGSIRSRHDSCTITARSEGPSTSRSFASTAKSLVHPAMMRLFEMADRRDVGWLNVMDLQVFLEYHGHKQWASPSFIRKTLVDLGISKGGNEPIKQHHFLRFLFFLIQKDPLMEFAARPLPPDELSIGVPEQAKELAAILKAAARNSTKQVAARRRLNRALTAQQPLTQSNAQTATAASAGPGPAAEGGRKGGDSGALRDQQWSHQVAPHVLVRDLVVARRPSTAPAARGTRGSHTHLKQKGGRGPFVEEGGGGGGTGGKKGLDSFLSIDHSVQASLVETVTDVRPGVTVQEMAFSEGKEEAEGSASQSPEIIRMKAGPAELQVPGRLSRSAYKALSRSRKSQEMPMGLNRPSTTPTPGMNASGDAGIPGAEEETHPLKSGVVGIRGGIRSSTAPMGLRGFFGAADGPDPRLLGGSRVSATGYDGGDDGERRIGFDVDHARNINGSISEGVLSPTSRAREGVPPGNGDDGGLSPFFVGEDIGSSSMGVDAPGGRRAPDTHAIIPRRARPAFSASGASRARVSSPGMGVRGGKRGRRAVAAW